MLVFCGILIYISIISTGGIVADVLSLPLSPYSFIDTFILVPIVGLIFYLTILIFLGILGVIIVYFEEKNNE